MLAKPFLYGAGLVLAGYCHVDTGKGQTLTADTNIEKCCSIQCPLLTSNLKYVGLHVCILLAIWHNSLLKSLLLPRGLKQTLRHN